MIGTTNNPTLVEYLQDKKPEDYYGLNCPKAILLNITGVVRTFQHVQYLRFIRQGGRVSEMVYQSTKKNRFGNYPIFSIVVKRNDNQEYSFYLNSWDGTRVWC